MDAEALGLIEYAKGLNPEYAKRLEDIYTPKGDSLVAKSKNFTFIVSCILKGMQPRAVSVALSDDRQERIP